MVDIGALLHVVGQMEVRVVEEVVGSRPACRFAGGRQCQAPTADDGRNQAADSQRAPEIAKCRQEIHDSPSPRIAGAGGCAARLPHRASSKSVLNTTPLLPTL